MGFTEHEVHGHAFATVLLQSGGRKIGLLRMSSFGQGNYPDLCAEEWERNRQINSTCNGKCQDDFVYRVLPNRLLSELEKATLSLKQKNITGLVVDLTGNEGGTGWVGAAIRILTDKPILCGQFGFLKHPHWIKHFQRESSEIRQKLLRTFEKRIKSQFEDKLKKTQLNLAQASLTCDRSGLWYKQKPLSCSLVVKEEVSDCEPGDDFHFRKGLYSGELYVLTDHRTASAAEDTVARLKESGAATILGETTYGSGCGYVDNPIPFELPNSKLKVNMPNCVRYSRQGINEVMGLQPDVPLTTHDLHREAFTESLVRFLTSRRNGK